MKLIKVAFVLLALCISFRPDVAFSASSGDRTTVISGSFDDVFRNLQDAVINLGLVIDYVGHVDRMLERTAEAAGKSQSPYLNARYFQFCSAPLTHEAVSIDASNLRVCPLLVFAFETKVKPGEILVGYSEPSLGSSDESRALATRIKALLRQVIDAAEAEN